jgi:cytochrome c oxidase subunit 2
VKLGPSFKGVYGADVKLGDGSTVKMDDAYIRSSLLSPQAQSRPGFPPSMPVIPLSDKEIEGVIEFIKAQK